MSAWLFTSLKSRKTVLSVSPLFPTDSSLAEMMERCPAESPGGIITWLSRLSDVGHLNISSETIIVTKTKQAGGGSGGGGGDGGGGGGL